MAKRNDNTQSRPSSGDMFVNPIGSTGQSTYRGETQEDPTTRYTVYGTGGTARHNGYFSSNNPYFSQLQIANNNQDKDALYELAIQWEADYANRQIQLDENKKILDEQREYDSPLAQVQRAREAGINPDLEGSGSLGSSGSQAQLANPGMADQTGQSKFSNKYDNTALVFEGINTAAGTISALSSSVGTIMNAVSNLKTMPSQIALNEANAGLSDAKANEINELLDSKKEGQLISNEAGNLQNIGAGIKNATDTLSFLAEVSNLIDPSADDDTLMPYLNSLGVPEANQLPFRDIIRQMHANPQMRDKYAKAELSARWSETENAQYTDGIVAEMTEMDYKITYEQKHWQYETTNLKNKISAALNTDTFVERTVSNEMESLLLQGETLGVKHDEVALVSQQLKNDTEAYLNSLKDRAATLEEMDKTIEYLQKSGKQTPYVKAQIDRIRAEKIALRGMLSSEFNQIKTHYLITAQQLYNNSTLLNSNSNVLDEGKRSKPNFFSDVTFNDLIYHTRTPGQIANQWVNTGISAAGVVVDAVGVKRGFDFNTTYRDVHNNRQFNSGKAAGYEAAKKKYGIQ